MPVIGHCRKRTLFFLSTGRMIDALLTITVLPRVSEELLTRMMEGRSIKRVHWRVSDGDFGYAFD
jgi:type VI secretion system protein VasG